jgi:hypothetical protein
VSSEVAAVTGVVLCGFRWLAEGSKADCAVLIALRNPLPALTPPPIEYRQVWAAKMIAPNLPDLQDSMCMIPKHASTIPC